MSHKLLYVILFVCSSNLTFGNFYRNISNRNHSFTRKSNVFYKSSYLKVQKKNTKTNLKVNQRITSSKIKLPIYRQKVSTLCLCSKEIFPFLLQTFQQVFQPINTLKLQDPNLSFSVYKDNDQDNYIAVVCIGRNFLSPYISLAPLFNFFPNIKTVFFSGLIQPLNSNLNNGDVCIPRFWTCHNFGHIYNKKDDGTFEQRKQASQFSNFSAYFPAKTDIGVSATHMVQQVPHIEVTSDLHELSEKILQCYSFNYNIFSKVSGTSGSIDIFYQKYKDFLQTNFHAQVYDHTSFSIAASCQAYRKNFLIIHGIQRPTQNGSSIEEQTDPIKHTIECLLILLKNLPLPTNSESTLPVPATKSNPILSKISTLCLSSQQFELSQITKYLQVTQEFKDCGIVKLDTAISTLELHVFKHHNDYIALGLSGKNFIASGIRVSELLTKLPQVKQVYVVGIAGSSNHRYQVGDVCIPKAWYWHSRGYLFETEHIDFLHNRLNVHNHCGNFLPNKLKAYSCPDNFYNKAKSCQASLARKGIRLCFDTIGTSGSVFVDNEQYRKFLKQAFNSDVVDMESFAIAHLCQKYGKDFIAIRAISDLAGKRKTKDETNYIDQGGRDYAAKNAAIAFIGILNSCTHNLQEKTFESPNYNTVRPKDFLRRHDSTLIFRHNFQTLLSFDSFLESSFFKESWSTHLSKGVKTREMRMINLQNSLLTFLR